MTIDPTIIERAERWLNGNIDEESKQAIRNMMENDPNELVESF